MTMRVLKWVIVLSYFEDNKLQHQVNGPYTDPERVAEDAHRFRFDDTRDARKYEHVDVVELWPSYESFGIRFEFFGDEVEKISYINTTSCETLADETQVFIYPAKHYVMPAERIEQVTHAARILTVGVLDEVARALEGRSESKAIEVGSELR